MNKLLIAYLFVLWIAIVHSLISVFRTNREIKRLKRASALLERMPALAESGKLKMEDAFEILNLLRAVPSDFALLIAEEKIDKAEGVTE